MFPTALVCAIVLLAGLPIGDGAQGPEPTTTGPDGPISRFAESLAGLAGEHHLPGLSAALIVDQEIAWSAGFGFADLEQRIPAGPDTPYRLASLSKPLASMVLAILVERGDLDLDARMNEFAVHAWFEPGGGSWAHYPSRYEESPITIRHVLTHTSQASPPGDGYSPLYSAHTAAGIVSTVVDLARFDIALDRNDLVSEETRTALFTPARSSDGTVLPYGRGWFVEESEGLRVVWHYGWNPPTVSALYIKVPERNLTLILLSNSDGLSAGVSWTRDGVRASPFARLFLESFASE